MRIAPGTFRRKKECLEWTEEGWIGCFEFDNFDDFFVNLVWLFQAIYRCVWACRNDPYIEEVELRKKQGNNLALNS